MTRGSFGTDARALVKAYELDEERALPFLRHATTQGRGRLMNFAAAHPWLVQYAAARKNVESCKPIVLATPDPDIAASLVMARSGMGMPAGYMPVIRRLRHFAQPELMVGPEIVRYVNNARRIPDDLWPGPVPAGTPLLHPAQQAMAGFLYFAQFVVGVSDLSRRTVPDILGRFDGWGPYIEKLRIRAGVEPMEPDRTDSTWCIAGDIMTSATDMLHAFEAEVVRPAVYRIDPDLVTPHEYIDWLALGQHEGKALTEMALRLLLRDGTLPRLVETSREWHGRSPAIARRCALTAGDRLRAGPNLFERMPLADGTYLVCLNEPHELLSEGLNGPDTEGRPGLAHCVGSYIQRVSNARRFILGVRAPDPELGWRRIATVELGRVYRDGLPEVVQHRGRLNAEVSAGEKAALAAALPLIAAHMRVKQGEPEDREELNWTPILAETGSWECLRDEWSFAIERRRRGLDFEEFLAGVWDDGRMPVLWGPRP